MAQKVKIGYVILTWNSERYLRQCLASIFRMERIKPYVIVADNGSTDRTRQILREQKMQQGPCLQIICFDRNKGTTIPRNAALKKLMELQLDYYCVLDSDTEVNEESMITLIEEMESHPEYGLIGPKMIAGSGAEQVSGRNFPTLPEKLCKAFPWGAIQALGEQMEQPNISKKESSSYPVDYLFSACWLLRPQIVKEAGLLDEKIFYAPEDAEYCIRVWKSGYKVAFCPKAQIRHEWQRLSKRRFFSRLNYEHLKGLAYMFRKHNYLFSAEKLKSGFQS